MEKRTALDAYRDFGEAFQKLMTDLLEMGVTPMHVSQNFSEASGLPEAFGPLVVRVLAARRTDQLAAKPRIPTFESPNPFTRVQESGPGAIADPSPSGLGERDDEATSEPSPDASSIEIEDLRRRVAAVNQDQDL